MIRVAVAGGFDPLHIGHLRHLQKAKALGNYLIVLVSNDEDMIRKKGYCFMILEHRIEILRALSCVDEVIKTVDSDGTQAKTLRVVRPNVFAKGGDRTPDNMPRSEISICKEIECEIVYGVGDQLASSSELTQRIPKTKVYAYVVGDLLHIGHLRALQQAKVLGDYLIVGVLTDEATTAYKRRPIIPFNERLELVKNLVCVDEVMKQDTLDPTENLKALRDVSVVVHGNDWDENFPGADYMRSIGRKAIRTKYYLGQSTTRIIEKINGTY